MASQNDLPKVIAAMAAVEAANSRVVERFKAEFDFAVRMTQAHPEKAAAWQPLLVQAGQLVAEGLTTGGKSVEALVAEAEGVLAPLGQAAKEYVIHCCGHGHIDMNWMWSWPETVSVTYDTFATMDQLMDEFPEFKFSQSQASVYHIAQQYAPALFERIKQRVAEGRWEVTASQWVEGDKNLASGEILCRHLLYTRRWFQETMGLPYDHVKVDWECDTFGHCWTLPGILSRGGVRRYYHHRVSGPRLRAMAAGETSQLFWWEGKDGSRVLTYDDSPNGYNGEITPHMTHLLFALEKNTGLKTLLWVYGVGDHGGGPTRRHLRAAQEMAQWPIFPQVLLSTTDAFFSAVEAEVKAKGIELPVHQDELNFVFEGCYTSESRIKFANRKGENDLVDTEICALAGRAFCGMPYPREALNECWQRSMFLQFHDILPGSGVKETVEHALGLFQENLATTGMIRTQRLRAFADKVNTAALVTNPQGADLGLGGGAGDGAWWGGLSTLGAGPAGADPFVVYNLAPFARDELVRAKIWNRDLADGSIVVRDPAGKVVAGQVIERGAYWGHNFAVVAFPSQAIPGIGFRAFAVEAGNVPAGEASGAYVKETGRPVYGLGYVNAQLANPVVMGNEFFELTVSSDAGGIVSLVDNETGEELVPEGFVLGAIEREQEAPHGMTAWQLGTIVDQVEPLTNGTLQVLHQGPHLAAVRLAGKHNDSDYALTISVAAGKRDVEFALDVNWLERGDPATGVPTLRASFPIGIEEGKATHEIACGTIERPCDGEEVPALNWVDVTGVSVGDDTRAMGATLLNDCKYGHQCFEDAIRLTLLRSSYDPDPLPEIGRHSIRFALVPHFGPFEVKDAVRAGYAFNHPLVVVGTTVHAGEAPNESSMLELRTPNVMVSGFKQAEDSEAIIVRLYEFAGQETQARVWICEEVVAPDAAAVETDLLEQPLATSSAKMKDSVLTVKVPAFGITTVRVG